MISRSYMITRSASLAEQGWRGQEGTLWRGTSELGLGWTSSGRFSQCEMLVRALESKGVCTEVQYTTLHAWIRA